VARYVIQQAWGETEWYTIEPYLEGGAVPKGEAQKHLKALAVQHPDVVFRIQEVGSRSQVAPEPEGDVEDYEPYRSASPLESYRFEALQLRAHRAAEAERHMDSPRESSEEPSFPYPLGS
jgi:hypothetical protein